MKALDFDGARGPRAWDLWPADLQRAWHSTRRELDALKSLPLSGGDR
jgi:hypothetical protein